MCGEHIGKILLTVVLLNNQKKRGETTLNL